MRTMNSVSAGPKCPYNSCVDQRFHRIEAETVEQDRKQSGPHDQGGGWTTG